jgi:hypothetical protein
LQESLLAPSYTLDAEADGSRELRTGGSYAEARRTMRASRSRLSTTELDSGGLPAALPAGAEEATGAEAEASELFLQVKGRRTSLGGSVAGRSAAASRRATDALAPSAAAAAMAAAGMAAVPLRRVSDGRAAAWPPGSAAHSSARSTATTTTTDELDYASFFPVYTATRRSTAHEIAEQAVDQLLGRAGAAARGGAGPSRRSVPGAPRRPSQPGALEQAQALGQGQGQGRAKGPSISIELAGEAAVPVSTHAGRASSRGASRRGTMNG